MGSQTWPQRRPLLPLFPSWLQELRLDLSPTCFLASACVHTQMLQGEVVGQRESPSAAFWSFPRGPDSCLLPHQGCSVNMGPSLTLVLTSGASWEAVTDAVAFLSAGSGVLWTIMNWEK